MGTTLTKPVLLDETGQDISTKINGVLKDTTGQSIVSKLNDIKEAIGVSGEFIPLKIVITTPPTKTTYFAGESLDLTGMVVKLLASNGSQIDITSECSFSPANGATLSATTDVTITYHWYKDNVDFTATQAVTVKILESITITTPPTTVNYSEGDTLDLTGLVVTASYDDTSTSDVTSLCTFSPNAGATLSMSDTSVEISFTQGGVTKTTNQAITVSPKIYGVELSGTASPILSRTDSASDFTDPIADMSDGNGGWTGGSSPFDTIYPWSEMTRETDENGNVWVKIPKFYVKLTASGGYLRKIQISATPQDGFRCSPAHAKRGQTEERDYVYIAAYCMTDNATSLSKSGVTAYPRNTTNLRQYVASHANVYNMDFCMLVTLWYLYMVEYANLDIQATIGYGLSTGSSANGACDSMSYHTGTVAASRSTAGAMRYRYIENLFRPDGFFIECYNWNSNYYLCYATNISDIGQSATNILPNTYQASGELSEMSVLTLSEMQLIYPARTVSVNSAYAEYYCDGYMGKPSSTLYTESIGLTNSITPTGGGGIFAHSYSQPSDQKYGRAMKIPASA